MVHDSNTPNNTPQAPDRQGPGLPLDTALAYQRAGLSVIPIKTNGTKSPATRRWKEFTGRLPSEARKFFENQSSGIAIIGGAVSGNLETIDFDQDAETNFPTWRELVEAQAPGLVDRLCLVRTPREPAGYHVRYRCRAVTIPGNTKLAQAPGINPESGKPCLDTLIETRGEGGYAVAPGSPPACHVTGRTWDHIAGPPLTELSDISEVEREILISAARSFDLAAAAKMKRPSSRTNAWTLRAEIRPGDDYDRRGPDWSEILEPHGWERGPSRGETVYWRRPGKDTPGYSATTGYCKGQDGADLLAVF